MKIVKLNLKKKSKMLKNKYILPEILFHGAEFFLGG